MSRQSINNLSRYCAARCTSLPPLFLAPSLQSLQLPYSKQPFTTPYHSFSTTPISQARVRNPNRNKSRGVSAIRRTGPRVPLSVSKYPLPVPVLDPPSRKDFKTRDDHGLWGFFNKEHTAMTTPEALNAHGRAWTYPELANKAWDDLWKIYWSCVKERNWLSTEANERNRAEAGYGDYEGEARDETVRKTMTAIRNVLRDRSNAFEDALKITGSVAFWKGRLAPEKKENKKYRRRAHQPRDDAAALAQRETGTSMTDEAQSMDGPLHLQDTEQKQARL